jgi:lysophospholipase L1-like esterase
MPSRFLVALLAAALVTSSHADPVLKPGDTLTMCGDSITQQGIYTTFVDDYLHMCQPVTGVKVIQCGWGGTTAPHFAEHMKDFALAFSPTVATTAFGMNDGDMAVCTPQIEQRYREGLTQAIDNFVKSGTRTVIVGSPGAVDSYYFKNPHDAKVTAEMYNQTLGRLTEIAKEVATAKGMPFADLHTPMMAAMVKAKAERGEKYPVFGEMDGVHATPNGHLIMAYAFLKAMGFDGNIGTITYDAVNGHAQATDGHRIISSKPGEVTIESTRYPYCFTRGNDHPAGPTAGILPYLPFNDELNRYLLIVKNLKSAKAKITWGDESKEFTAEQLGKGINLAAEFLKNPFVPAFAAVDKQVAMKDDFEIFAVTFYMGQRKPDLMKALPDKAASFPPIDAGFRDIDSGLQENCFKELKPVTHTIKIEE